MFRWIGRVIAWVGRLFVSVCIGAVALFARSLDFMLGVVTRLYERFDAGWNRLSSEARERHAREGRRTLNRVDLDSRPE
ncbi:hypothetical protein LOK46_13395 [Methylobacterium sp. NMS14P]|uniref:hypothetical protein n=1 Tax=Methylobacterium sp. NMS14P TaxID=2894310 RepID=UPI0023581947|nr:hypothetical protein [Methylobacterium sp. NMS14P]WCS27769.1 hypothetical protein LOK46_13395 [Methylobacterium sp. NMS14P]